MTKRQASTETATQARTVKPRRRASEASAEPVVERVPRKRDVRPKAREADFVVIGAGSGGVAAARRAASHGARVILVERDAIGGTCVNRGCVPKKMLSYGAGWASILSTCLSHTGGKEDWRDAIVRVNAEVARLNASYKQRLNEARVEVWHGDASFNERGDVVVGNEVIRAGKTLIATGASPIDLPVPGGELVSTSDDVFTWQTVPASIVVVGGGYIAVEMASILSRYGVKVDLLVREDRLLPKFDHDIADALAEALIAKGIRIHFRTEVTMVSQSNGAFDVCYTQEDNRGRTQTVRTQAVLAAIGRKPNVDGLGLDELGVKRDNKGGIKVDRQFRSSVRSIHAIGDCMADNVHLTPVAVAQGRWLADRLFDRRGDMTDFEFLPTAVFCEPAIGAVGLTEAQAIEEAGGKADRVRTEIKRFVSLENRFGGVPLQSVFKLVFNARSGRVLGVHLMDGAAPEIIQTMALALRLGVKASHLKTTMPLHPTVAEELFG
ncbi:MULTISPECIES: FAD-dependent oxidoreductase [unclassified Cupriavidus]|uniref:dihydrolipoyl dehydrogenase family protein n=1 Tax=unclassified Cupriavidus TaxID=2640874 RepID=UPI001C0062B8|nr:MULTISPECIES: FAD-dependent oxidoreductase [unclassified Cupriavidus]MCA3185288.1 FAD-dependent oxidoreductase [Cupriavidus sp.]MCA3190136.1 FAD-dependent oxidoreductase [Cupriavidus sp.]MCA3197587.1 FAD-dependent oxidoreductase [Cupriavidus sp.]MCA3201926.1 FAD-dependent oxidoreductase [Cupriavidus sp.]MCA3234213.1 FAD-dependent oxidoreductase [Cupriavidus sp.]